MKEETLHLLGVNHHQTGVDLYIGTEDELCDIATAGNNEIFEVSPEEKADPDSPWPEGPGWYYAIGDREYTKVDTRFEGIAAILQHDGHPLSFTTEQAKEILRRADAGEDTGLWHHNRSKVISAIRRCLEERNLIEQPEYVAVIAEDLEGPAYGVGKTEAEAREQARESGFGESGVVVKITEDSFNRISAGNPDAVELAE